jgi:RES domain-containing protein
VTPFPVPLVAWRLGQQHYATQWDSGEGAYRLGGRWNSKGTRAVYASVDPATAILEVAVHKGFSALDRVPHCLTRISIVGADVHCVAPTDIPYPAWLWPGIPSAGQQQFGDALLNVHAFVLLPSVVSRFSWNLIFDPLRAAGQYRLEAQTAFGLDGRLHPPR